MPGSIATMAAHMVGVLRHIPARDAALRVRHQDGILSGARIDLVDRRGHRLRDHSVVDVLVTGRIVMPVSGVIWRKNWSSTLLALRELRTFVVGEGVIQIGADTELGVPGFWSDGSVVIVPATEVCPASPRRGWSISHTLWPIRRNRSDHPSRPSGVVIQPMRDWP